MGNLKIILMGCIILMGTSSVSYGEVSEKTMESISRINKVGPYIGLVVPNSFEMAPLLQSNSFAADQRFPYLDFAGKRFRIGKLENEKIILVMTGLGMLNAGLTTQLLVSLFKVKGVLHFGIAGNANPNLQIGDVTIPHYWAHTGLWNWQRYGNGPDDELALESNGDYTRRIGYLKFSKYNNVSKNEKSSDNLLNNAWYQPEEIFPVNGVPEVRQHAFWVSVDKRYFAVSRKLEGMTLEGCINATTCLPRAPVVVRVRKGSSANAFIDNAAYRQFLNSKFNITAIDMESAAVALVCRQQSTPFIAFRALSDLAGGGSAESNEASVFASLAAQNAVTVVAKFISLLLS
ncbi:bark storage protein A isoform X2 [Magnolia sinica]|uniref:bark storage protein A isoform X2 n=1 Tax=Magnolia sinica TaxID=86752 RepID=UPI00265B6BD3|nr:bark storage protein A isoform X2 [Magnolia sinica]